jgi:hypothetical protein
LPAGNLGAGVEEVRLNMFKKAAWMILLLICEGHVSRIYNKEVDLEKLIAMSGYIFVVEKSRPFLKSDTIEIDDSKTHPPFISSRQCFRIVEVLKNGSSDKIKSGTGIEVNSAYDGTRLAMYRKFRLDGISVSPIFETYNQGSHEIEKQDRYIVFLQARGEQGRYSFSVNDAVESVLLKEEIRTKAGKKR